MILLSVSNSCTPDILCWNIVQSASAYSTLTGVLAGFLVTAIVFSLEHRTRDDNRQNHNKDGNKRHISIPVYAASVACLSLALSSFLFALLNGADLSSPASTSLAYILGSAAFGTFALSVVQLMLSIIWLFTVHEINLSVIRGIKILFRFMLAVGMLYMFKFSVDVLRVKSGDTQEHPWIFLLLLAYALYAYAATRLGVRFIRRKWEPALEEKTSGIANKFYNSKVLNKLYNKVSRRLRKNFYFSGMRLDGFSLIILSHSTGLFIIGTTLIYGLLAADFINWFSSFNKLNYSFYLFFTILVYVLSPFFFILAQLSLPEAKGKEEPAGSPLASDTQAHGDEEAKVQL